MNKCKNRIALALSSYFLSLSLFGQGKITTPILEVTPETDPKNLATFLSQDKGLNNKLTIENATTRSTFIPLIRFKFIRQRIANTTT